MSKLFVNVWEEKVTIPTYGVGQPEKNPMFFEKRVYQGSSGVVYPNPVIEKIDDEKADVTYTALFLENKYLKIMVLPELGGRVQMAYDKVKERHFVYYNHVIKPALVGLCGPWISGGIEFNWPQHHRPSTFEPVDYSIQENRDGSKTVWVNEVEKMFHTKGMAGFTLYEDKAYLEISVKLYNRTALPQTFLWWANPAVKVNDHYQSVFPADVNAVFDHGKRDVASFPIATGTYYKVDYAPGTDISNYKNIPVPTSYMAIRSNYDFVGGYENDTKAGLLHVANHHVSPGKKQWTWGNGDFGKAWDRNLTDEDGPYIELMTGVYTDNQPDFTWLMPYEEKSFKQYFMPYHELGMVKNATKDILVALDIAEGKATAKVYATSEHRGIELQLHAGDRLIHREVIDCSPENVFVKVVPLRHPDTAVKLVILGEDGRKLIDYDPAQNRLSEVPEAAKAAQPPGAVENNEQLYLTGLHLEQYRHATYNPVDYYEEALRRDPKDARNNNALGKWYLRRGRFAESERYFKRAIETYTERNPNPFDGEPYYNLGLCRKYQNRLEEAYEAFYKATWNSAWQDSAYFSLAQIDLCRGDLPNALEHIEWALDRNMRNGKAWHLKSVALRKSGNSAETIRLGAAALARDHFNLGIYFELAKAHGQLGENAERDESIRLLHELAGSNVNSFLEYALDYAAMGLYDEAIEFLGLIADNPGVKPAMYLYYLGWLHIKVDDTETAAGFFQRAASADPGRYFSNQLAEIEILETAMRVNPNDAKAPYYLGNLWYDKRHYTQAIAMWELSKERNGSFPTVHRNLGIAYFNKENNADKALHAFERAFRLDERDARVFMELDQLHKRLNRDAGERLGNLEKYGSLVEQRDDLYLERIALYNFTGNHEKALQLTTGRKFHPWEGGEGKVPGQYTHSLVELAKVDIDGQRYADAIDKLARAQEYPPNLGEGKLFGARENDICYWLGRAHDGLQERAEAEAYFRKATEGPSEPTAAVYYNDQQPDKIFYQGLAWLKLGERERGTAILRGLCAYGNEHLDDEVKIDYFAVSLPDMLIFEDDPTIRNRVHCLYLIGLGHLGLGELEEARQAFERAMQHDAMHFGIRTHLAMAKRPQLTA